MDKTTALETYHTEVVPDQFVHEDEKHNTLVEESKVEHELTLAQVFQNHKPLATWTLYWALCAIAWGFDAQVNGAMIAVPAFRRDFGYLYKGEYVLPASWQTAFNVISSPGGLIGGFLCSYIADRFGRKSALLAAIITCSGGIVGQILSTTRVAFLMSKFVLGLGLGFYLTLGPMMTSELTPVVLRGIATAGVNLGIALGQLLSNAAIAGFGGRSDRWSYRAPFALQLAFVALFLAGWPFAPESPFYLIKRGRVDDARKTLVKLYGQRTDVERKLLALQVTVEEETAMKRAGEGTGLLDCFRGTNRIRTVISLGVFVCQHAVGIIFVLGFSSYFFQLAGLDTSNSFALGVGVTACGVAGNILSWFFINSTGRRKIFVIGMAVLTVMLLLIGIMDLVPSQAAKWVQAAITVVWAFVYFFSIGAMAFAILGETSSVTMRAHTAALATATQSIMGIIMNFSIPYMINPDMGHMNGKVGFVFGGLGILGTIWSFFYVPELKGRTFHEIDRMFAQRIPPRKMGTYQFS